MIGAQRSWSNIWAAACLLLSIGITLHADVARFRRPQGERAVLKEDQGSDDLRQPFIGAVAMLLGENPYDNKHPALVLPHGWTQTYPPSTLLLYVPLAWITKGNFDNAAVIWFYVNLVCLFGLAAITATLMATAWRDRSISAATFFAPALICLTLSSPSLYAVERGQTEIVTAMLCWGTVLLFVKRRVFAAMLVGGIAAGLKGYGGLFVAGIGLFCLRRGQWRQAAAGFGLAMLLTVLPVWKYLSPWLKFFRARMNMFTTLYVNHGYQNVSHYTNAATADRGRSALLLMTLLAALFTAWCVFKVDSAESSQGDTGNRGRVTAWVSLFAIAALAVLIGAPRFSACYTMELILPGALIVTVGQHHFARDTGDRPLAHTAVAIGLLPAIVCLFWYHVEGYPDLPLGGFGLAGISLFALLVSIAAIGSMRGRSRQLAVAE